MAENLNKINAIGRLIEVAHHGGRMIGGLLQLQTSSARPCRILVITTDIAPEITAELQRGCVIELEGELFFDGNHKSHNVRARWVHLLQHAEQEATHAPA